jgi:hypothetical protein
MSTHLGILATKTVEFKQTMYETYRTRPLLYHPSGFFKFYWLFEALYALKYAISYIASYSHNSFNFKQIFF